MKRIGALLAVLSLAWASAAAAQVRGDRVRVVSPEFTGEGVVASVTSDTLVVTTGHGEVSIARATIERLDVAFPRERDSARGGFVGCAIGATLGAVGAAIVQAAGGGPYDGVDRRTVMWLAIGAGAAGCAIGALVSSGGGVVWEPVVTTEAAAYAAGGRLLLGVTLRPRR